MNELKKTLTKALGPVTIILSLLCLAFLINGNGLAQRASAITMDSSVVPDGIAGNLDLGSLTYSWRSLFLNNYTVGNASTSEPYNYEGVNPGRGYKVIGLSTAQNFLCYPTGNKSGACERHGLKCNSSVQFFINPDNTISGDYNSPCTAQVIFDADYTICMCQ